MKFLIIGGDAAGMSAASRAKRNLPDLDVTVLEQTQDVSYSACGMPYNIADPDRKIEDLVVRQAKVFREKQGINLLTGHRAESIDPEAKNVYAQTEYGKGQWFAYDKLLIATGARPIRPNIPGMDLPGVMVLKNLDHGRQIKDYISKNNVAHAMIVGMGYIGLEMCEALRQRGIDVEMVELSADFLPWMNPTLSDIVKKEVESRQVRLHLGARVDKIEPHQERLSLIMPSGACVTDMVLMAIGITPNSEIAEKAGIELGVKKSISVDKVLQTSRTDIFAAGDCADAFHVVTGKKVWIPLALRANRAGWAVADTISGKPTELQGVCGTAVFKVFDVEVARTGLNETEALESGFLPLAEVVKTRSRAHGHPGAADIWVYMVADQRTGRLLGVQMVGKEGVAHRINAAAVALHNQMTVAQFAQTDLAYAPPFGPVWDPLLTAANQLSKKI